jgi:hypothetical protein
MGKKKITLHDIRRDVIHVCGDVTGQEYRYAIIMLSSAMVGTSVRRLREFTGYTTAEISELRDILRTNGIWKGGKIHAGWFEKDGGVEFCCDVAVAMGYLQRA